MGESTNVPGPQPLSQDRLEALLQQRSEMAQQPLPTPGQVLAKWLDNLGVGLGAGVAVAVLLWLLKAPGEILLTRSLALGLLAFAAMMIWRGSLDERSDWCNTRAIRRTVTAMRSEFDNQVRTLGQQLDAAFDEIETLERSVDQVASERDMALIDLGRERKQAEQNTRRTFVQPEDPTPQDVKDAHEMLRFYFDTGRHLSRRRAQEDKRWSAERWKAAQALLVRAGVLTVNETQPAMLAQTLGEAFGKLNTYLVHARSQQPPVTAARNGYVEPDST